MGGTTGREVWGLGTGKILRYIIRDEGDAVCALCHGPNRSIFAWRECFFLTLSLVWTRPHLGWTRPYIVWTRPHLSLISLEASINWALIMPYFGSSKKIV